MMLDGPLPPPPPPSPRPEVRGVLPTPLSLSYNSLREYAHSHPAGPIPLGRHALFANALVQRLSQNPQEQQALSQELTFFNQLERAGRLPNDKTPGYHDACPVYNHQDPNYGLRAAWTVALLEMDKINTPPTPRDLDLLQRYLPHRERDAMFQRHSGLEELYKRGRGMPDLPTPPLTEPAAPQLESPATSPPPESPPESEVTRLSTQLAEERRLKEQAEEENSRLTAQLTAEKAAREKAEEAAALLRTQIKAGQEGEGGALAQARKELQTANSAKLLAEDKAAEASKLADEAHQLALKSLQSNHAQQIITLRAELSAGKENANTQTQETAVKLKEAEQRVREAESARDEAQRLAADAEQRAQAAESVASAANDRAVQTEARARGAEAARDQDRRQLTAENEKHLAEIARLRGEIASLQEKGIPEDKQLIRNLSAQLETALKALTPKTDIQTKPIPDLIPKVLKDQFLTGETRTHLTSAVTRLLTLLETPPTSGEMANLVNELLSGKMETVGTILGRIITKLNGEEGKAFAESLAPIWKQIEMNARKSTLQQILTLLKEELSKGQIDIQDLPEL